MKAIVGAFNQEKALVGAFSVIVKIGCGTDGALHSTSLYNSSGALCCGDQVGVSAGDRVVQQLGRAVPRPLQQLHHRGGVPLPHRGHQAVLHTPVLILNSQSIYLNT